MNCEEYINQIKKDYDLIKVFSNKNNSIVALFKHKKLGKYIVLRKYNQRIDIYEKLKGISFEGLPLIYDTVNLDDGQIILEEYIEGLTVADVIENKTFTYNGAKKVMISLCNTLSLLHSFGYVHRDIKPENILISNEGIVKLIDFNASRHYNAEQTKDTIEIGTIGYASPEQFGIAQTDTRTDIYALGVLLNIMLTGNHPSKELTNTKAKKIVLKCTQIDPNSRFQTVDELLNSYQ